MLNKIKKYPYISLLPICLGVFIAADDQTVIVTIIPEIMNAVSAKIEFLIRVALLLNV